MLLILPKIQSPTMPYKYMPHPKKKSRTPSVCINFSFEDALYEVW